MKTYVSKIITDLQKSELANTLKFSLAAYRDYGDGIKFFLSIHIRLADEVDWFYIEHKWNISGR